MTKMKKNKTSLLNSKLSKYMYQNVKSWAIFQNFCFQFCKSTTFKIFARTKFRELGQHLRKTRKLTPLRCSSHKLSIKFCRYIQHVGITLRVRLRNRLFAKIELRNLIFKLSRLKDLEKFP